MAMIADVLGVNHFLTLEGAMNEETVHNRGHNAVRFEIVRTQEQMLDALSIRAIVYMEDEGVAARLAFDGNDFQATHVVAYDGDEPCGAIRIRWFNGFAKLERMAMRKAFRNTRVIRSFLDFVFAHVARKGYPMVLTHASPIYARLWCRLYRWEEVTDKRPAHFKGHEEPYVELMRRLDVPDNAITTETDVTTLYRVEGAWDHPSSFEAHD
jgi:hypothetical protein